jgi:hypothetical protein
MRKYVYIFMWLELELELELEFGYPFAIPPSGRVSIDMELLLDDWLTERNWNFEFNLIRILKDYSIFSFEICSTIFCYVYKKIINYVGF